MKEYVNAEQLYDYKKNPKPKPTQPNTVQERKTLL